MNLIAILEQEEIARLTGGQAKPEFAPGDTVIVSVNVVEGTRKRVDKWKGGFLKIAQQAQVPILMAYFHYPEKTIGIGDVYYPTGDMDTDMAAIRAWYQPWQGKNRGTV